MELWFTEAETTFSYFEATEHYVLRHGKPLAWYSDKLSVFRVNLPNDLSGTGTTQFTRAMKQLDIEVICANTPQAKGRVERVNQLLQDRLVKEMRLRGIASMAEAMPMRRSSSPNSIGALRSCRAHPKTPIVRSCRRRLGAHLDSPGVAGIIQEPHVELSQSDLPNSNGPPNLCAPQRASCRAGESAR